MTLILVIFFSPGNVKGMNRLTFSREQFDKDLVVINDFHCRSHGSVR